MKKFFVLISLFFAALHPLFAKESISDQGIFELSLYEIFEKAENLRKASLFDSSIKFYEEALNLSQNLKETPQSAKKQPLLSEQTIRMGLANAYFQAENYEKTIEVLDNKCDTEDSRCLIAMALNRLKKYKETLVFLENSEEIFEKEAILFEKAYAKFYLQELKEAKKLFSLLKESPLQELSYLSKIYMAKIDLINLERTKVEDDLKEIEKNLPKNHPLNHSLLFLQGQYHISCQDYKRATQRFELLNSKKIRPYLALTLSKIGSLDVDQESSEKEEALLYKAEKCYLKGVNFFKQGLQDVELSQEELAKANFNQASLFFEKAVFLSEEIDKKISLFSLKQQAKALINEGSEKSLFLAYSLLEKLEKKEKVEEFIPLHEIYSLKAHLFLKLEKQKEGFSEPLSLNFCKKLFLEKSQPALQKSFSDQLLNLMAISAYNGRDYDLASQIYLELIDEFPDSSFIEEAYFFAALSLEKKGKEKPNKQKENDLFLAKELKKKLFTEYKDSEYAAEAYFFYYPTQEYLEGERDAIQHLMKFETFFPKSPHLLKVYYLLGMDCQRDRKTPLGKWIRKKNLISAVRYFQSLESKFKELESSFSSNEYFHIRYLSKIELGLTYLKIAEESQKVKSGIYLEYAKTLFLEMREALKSISREGIQKELFSETIQQEPYPKFLEESSYLLGLTYIKLNEEEEAKKVFLEMIENYNISRVTRGIFLSKVYKELGILSAKSQNHQEALFYFLKAEDAAKGKILTSEQKLDLWIQMSLSYLALKEYDEAVLILSKVINDQTVSGQRVKAMFLRSEVYEASGRLDLSKKQLEATSKKGGEWGLKAKLKLEALEKNR